MNNPVNESGRKMSESRLRKMTASSSRKWLRLLGPSLRAAAVKGKMPMLQEMVVAKATSSPAYGVANGM